MIEGFGEPIEKATDGEGTVEIDVPVHVREIRLTFPDRKLIQPVMIGDMDPGTEASGARKRLAHLGYYDRLAVRTPGELGEDEVAAFDRRALLGFQAAQGLEATGELDDATKEALVKEHGS